jgi:hypothetical protein
MLKPKADCRACRKEAQKTQELRKQGPFLSLLRFFAAIPDFCNYLPILCESRICGLAAGAGTLAFQLGMNWLDRLGLVSGRAVPVPDALIEVVQPTKSMS